MGGVELKKSILNETMSVTYELVYSTKYLCIPIPLMNG